MAKRDRTVRGPIGLEMVAGGPPPPQRTHLAGHHPELHPAPVALLGVHPVGGLGVGRVRVTQPARPLQGPRFPQTGEGLLWAQAGPSHRDVSRGPLQRTSFLPEGSTAQWPVARTCQHRLTTGAWGHSPKAPELTALRDTRQSRGVSCFETNSSSPATNAPNRPPAQAPSEQPHGYDPTSDSLSPLQTWRHSP